MRVGLLLVGLLLASVAAGCDPSPCHRPLDEWCHHDWPDGPAHDLPCGPPELGTGELPTCGDLSYDLASGGYTSITHWFRDGEHIAAVYGTDTNTYCGGFQFTYGERVSCEPD